MASLESLSTEPVYQEAPADDVQIHAEIKEALLPKGSEKLTELDLGGVKVKVKTDATPALLKQTRELVDNLFETYASRMTRGVSAAQLSVLVAFNLAEELLRERERVRLLKGQVVESTERLSARIESFLARQE